jgi:hypothetical protein
VSNYTVPLKPVPERSKRVLLWCGTQILTFTTRTPLFNHSTVSLRSFNKLPNKQVSSWSTLIVSLSRGNTTRLKHRIRINLARLDQDVNCWYQVFQLHPRPHNPHLSSISQSTTPELLKSILEAWSSPSNPYVSRKDVRAPSTPNQISQKWEVN